MLSYIAKVLSATDENRTQAAKILGMGLRTLQRKLKKISQPAIMT
jgi:ActR/RegA family two-component response regulator